MDCRIIDIPERNIGRIRDIIFDNVLRDDLDVWVLVDGVALDDSGSAGKNRLLEALDAIDDDNAAELAAQLSELGNLALESDAVYFRRKKQAWEFTFGDPKFAPENTFTSVAELAATKTTRAKVPEPREP